MDSNTKVVINCSIIIPVRNEAGNIWPLLERIPELGNTEVIFVESGSTDSTFETLLNVVSSYAGPHKIVVRHLDTPGKWNAVKHGLDLACGQILIILDGDFTVSPRDLPDIYEITRGSTFTVANRLNRGMEHGAMPFINLMANKIFAFFVSLSLRTKITDSLCGTKAFSRESWLRIEPASRRVAKYDKFGDFILIFGAAITGMNIIEAPVSYRRRRYGSSNIRHVDGAIALFKAWVVGTIELTKARLRGDL